MAPTSDNTTDRRSRSKERGQDRQQRKRRTKKEIQEDKNADERRRERQAAHFRSMLGGNTANEDDDNEPEEDDDDEAKEDENQAVGAAVRVRVDEETKDDRNWFERESDRESDRESFVTAVDELEQMEMLDPDPVEYDEYEEAVEDVDFGDEDLDELPENSVMKEYLKAIVERLSFELHTRKKQVKVNWLLQHLKSNDFWIKAKNHRHICSKLKIPFHQHGAYYKDVKVWLPDIQYGVMPPCVNGCKECDVGNHGIDVSNVGNRLVYGLTKNYHMLTRRYICKICQRKKKARYTYRAWDPDSVQRLPDGLSLEFPAFLMKKSAFDKLLIDMMRPLMNLGVRPNGMASLIKELHTKRHHRKAARAEFENRKSKALGHQCKTFSFFGDNKGYAGRLPSPSHLGNASCRYHKTIRPYLDYEVKKRDVGDIIYLDTSFKVTKKMGSHRGKKVLDGLVTINGSHDESRQQFFVSSDAHDNYKEPLRQMKETMDQYGHPGPKYAYVDNPPQSHQFLLETFPSIRQEQERLDHQASNLPNFLQMSSVEPNGGGNGSQQFFDFEENYWTQNVSYFDTLNEVNLAAGALREVVRNQEYKILGFDAEWTVVLNARGELMRKDKVGLLQFSYRVDGCSAIKVHLYNVHGFNNLPTNLVLLLSDTSLTFVGCQVNGDVTQVATTFANCKKLNEHGGCRTSDIAMMARRRGVTPPHGSFSIEGLSEALTGDIVDKRLQLSVWGKTLDATHKKYAAIDAYKSLELHEILDSMPDLTVPLMKEEAELGATVDICPSTGSLATLTTLLATAKVIVQDDLHLPTGYEPAVMRNTDQRLLVEIDNLVSPGALVPRVKNAAGDKACLGDFGQVPLKIMLPIGMIRRHVPDRRHVLDENTNTGIPSAALEVAARIVQEKDQTDIQDDTGTRDDDAGGGTRMNTRSEHDSIFFMELEEDDEESLDNDYGVNEDDATVNAGNTGTGQQEANNSESEVINQASSLTATQIANIRACLDRACETIHSDGTWTPHDRVHLSPPPTTINDKFSAVLGDGFHIQHRFKLRKDHEDLKAFSVALDEALYAWNPTRMKEVVLALQKEGLSMDEIKARKYYNRDFFTDVVDRVCLAPSLLYYRIRAVFEAFGPRVSVASGKPLFSRKDWKIADNVLKEILAGYYSDPPGLSLYRYRLTASGTYKVNRLGLRMIECRRSTSKVENRHKLMVGTFGSWPMGFEMGDCVLAEHRHRCNHNASEKRRPGFPIVGHYDTWLVDLVQALVEEVHGMRLYPGHLFSNIYRATGESFGLVPIAPRELREKINEIRLPNNFRLSRDLQYYAERTDVLVPCLPWHGEQEWKLYPKLLLQELNKNVDMLELPERIAFSVLEHVDGKTIFPKLASYNRKHGKKYQKNQNIRESWREMREKRMALQRLNEVTFEIANNIGDSQNELEMAQEGFEDNNVPQQLVLPDVVIPEIVLPDVLPTIRDVLYSPQENVFAGGVRVDLPTLQATQHVARKPRGRDVRKRKARTCQNCQRADCPGARPGVSNPTSLCKNPAKAKPKRVKKTR